MSKEEVLSFWYGVPATTTAELGEKMKFWFQGGPEVDAEIARRFLPEIEGSVYTKYRGVIARFGRFPHRNAVLGRTSTPEELAFLAEWVQAPKAMAGGR